MKKKSANFLEKPDLSLEIQPKAIRSLTLLALKEVCQFYSKIKSQKVFYAADFAQLRQTFSEALPQKKTPLPSLLKSLFKKAVPAGVNLASGGYLAYIPIGTMFETALADYITSSVNRWPGIYEFAPGFIEIEKTVIGWLCQIMGMPKGSSGILTSGGSLANFSAVYTAKINRLSEDEKFLSGRIYVSGQAHYSVFKAARLAGFPKNCVRTVAIDQQCRIRIDELKKMIAADRAQGLKPFLLIGNAGSTATGAVDDLAQMALIAKREDMWFHVDAAWAGAFRLTERGKRLMTGVEEADSITIDPHKALYTSFGSGALLVRDLNTLRVAHTEEAPIFPDRQADAEPYSPSHISPELSRSVRGLQTWLPLKLHGITPYKNNMEEKFLLADWACEQIRHNPLFEIVTEPQMSIVTFSLVAKGQLQSRIDQLNKEIIARVNKDGRIHISGTTIHGRFVIRLVPFGMRTHKSHVALALKLIDQAAKHLSST